MPTLFIDYLPAELRENKEWYVRYYVKNPLTDKLHLKKIKINKIKSIVERRKFGRKLVVEINKKLESGWNPFLEQEASKSFTSIYVAFETYRKVKKKELEELTLRAYNSNLNILIDFIRKRKGDKFYVFSFTKSDAIDFLNYMYIEKNVAEHRYNTLLNFCKALFYWLMDANYIKANPFVGIKKKKTKEKKRKVIPHELRLKIKDYLLENNKEFLVNLLIQFHSLLRPNETLLIKVKNIDVKNQTIFVGADIAKNDNTRIATIPDVLLPYIQMLHLENYNPELYVFSDNLKPGKNRKHTKYLGNKWRAMRKKMGFADKYQMYSLRDSGIIQMLNDGISIEQVARQADHHSLSITSKYALHASSEANVVIKNKSSKF